MEMYIAGGFGEPREAMYCKKHQKLRFIQYLIKSAVPNGAASPLMKTQFKQLKGLS